MKRLLQELQRSIASGETAALITILQKRGSTPRGVGTAMVVRTDGSQEGTIGGGTLEYRARQHALTLFSENRGDIVDYSIDPEKQDDSNSVSVLFRVFSADREKRMLECALDTLDRERGYLVCRISDGSIGETEFVPERLAKEDAVLSLLRIKAPVLTEGTPCWWVEPLFEIPRVVILGGGHVAQALVPVLALLHYRVWVVEDREELCDSARFPQAERVLCDRPDMILEELELTEQDGIVSFVRGRGMELQTLASALRTRAGYIGSIGSRANARRMRDELISYGFSPERVSRIHSPVGLEIGAETPEQIAVSIAAELIACMRNRETV